MDDILANLPSLGTAGGLVAAVLWYMVRLDNRLFGLTDRQAKEITELRERESDNAERIARLERAMGYYRTGVMILVSQIRREGFEPEWEPRPGAGE